MLARLYAAVAGTRTLLTRLSERQPNGSHHTARHVACAGDVCYELHAKTHDLLRLQDWNGLLQLVSFLTIQGRTQPIWSRLTLIPSPLAVSDARIAVAMPPSTLTEQTQVGELPLEIVALVLLCLPLDARLRAREVSQDWRALLNEPRFWLVLDFSPGSGVVAPLTRALLFAAGERGRGHLCTLELTDADNLLEAEDLVQFVAAHT